LTVVSRVRFQVLPVIGFSSLQVIHCIREEILEIENFQKSVNRHRKLASWAKIWKSPKSLEIENSKKYSENRFSETRKIQIEIFNLNFQFE